MGNTKKNLMYNIIYQMLILFIPLITLPYVSRILGAEGIGIYSFSYSIVYYFMMFAMIGFNNYGNRTIAKSRDNKEKLTITFKEIHFLQIITSSIMIIFFYIFIFFYNSEYKLIFLIQSIHVWSCMFDISWFFFGLEEFKITVLRNTVIKILSLISIFLFVKTKDDVWVYTMIMSLSILLSQLSLWPMVNKRIDNKLVFKKNIKKHISPCLKLFLPVIAVSVYRIMDKTMIGVFSNVEQVGLYENAEKIVNIPIAIITAFGAVMLPKMSNLYSRKECDEKAKSIIEKSLNAIMFLSFAMTFGLFCISNDFSILFFGQSFGKLGSLIQYLSITILFLAWGNVIRTQYLIPMEMDKDYIISAFIGAFVNFGFNLFFIPRFGSAGACIGTVSSEFFVVMYQTIAVSKKLPIIQYIKNIIPFFIKAFIMFLIVYLLNYVSINPFVRIIVQVIIGVLIYALLNYKYLVNTINLSIFKKNVRKKTNVSI